MSTHLHVIFSETIKGAGMMAGGPYCVGRIWGVKETAEELAANAVSKAWSNFEEGLIDSPQNIKESPVFVLRETNDEEVSS